MLFDVQEPLPVCSKCQRHVDTSSARASPVDKYRAAEERVGMGNCSGKSGDTDSDLRC